MFYSTFINTVTTAIPSDIDARRVVDLLHNHSFVITLQPIVTRHSERSREVQIVCYDVWESIDLLPFGWWKQEIHFTATFEDKPDGVICRIEAPLGFGSRAEYTVRKTRSGELLSATPSTVEMGARDEAGALFPGMVLEEEIESNCFFLLKPFVEMTMVPVRKKLHSRIIEEARRH